MKAADGVQTIEIATNGMGLTPVIYPTLIWDDETLILVDAGYPGQLTQIEEAVRKAGIAFDKINRIIITHHDIDHMGSAVSIKEKLPESIKILAHREEIPYIQGEKLPLKLAQLEAGLENLSTGMKAMYEKLKTGFQSYKVNVDRSLTDGEELPYCGGIAVIHTPGHTLGHICLYLKRHKMLIAGDVLRVEDGLLIAAPEQINFDHNMYLKSLAKLTSYDIQTVICYHGGLYAGQVNKRIEELVNKQ
jgi:glyoxylase-like metal-dependent hydrolase (beta-lactamase superfamily II)